MWAHEATDRPSAATVVKELTLMRRRFLTNRTLNKGFFAAASEVLLFLSTVCFLGIKVKLFLKPENAGDVEDAFADVRFGPPKLRGRMEVSSDHSLGSLHTSAANDPVSMAVQQNAEVRELERSRAGSTTTTCSDGVLYDETPAHGGSLPGTPKATPRSASVSAATGVPSLANAAGVVAAAQAWRQRHRRQSSDGQRMARFTGSRLGSASVSVTSSTTSLASSDPALQPNSTEGQVSAAAAAETRSDLEETYA
jgi:hypothetical protein